MVERATTERPLKKVALINPRKGWRPALGLLYIAAFLRRAGYDLKVFEFLDEEFSSRRNQGVWRALMEWRPDVYGLGVISWNRIVAQHHIQAIRRFAPKAFIVCGGKDPSYMAHRYLDFGADCVVIGEGEETMVELLGALNDGSEWREIPGLAYLHGGRVTYSSHREPINLENLPLPAFDLVDYDHYTDIRLGGVPGHYLKTGFMMTTRGCPFQCRFCSEKVRNVYRERSIDDIVAEIKWQMTHYRIQGMVLLDDLFYFDEQRAADFCNRILQEGIRLKFYAQTRVDRAGSLETLRLMRKAGFIQLALGVESGSPRMLRAINKGTTVDMCKQTVARVNEAGILSYCFLIIGLPEETEEDLKLTAALVEEMRPSFVAVNYFMPMPGTRFFTEEDDARMDTLSYSLTENQGYRPGHELKTLARYRALYESLAQHSANRHLFRYPAFYGFLLKILMLRPDVILRGIWIQMVHGRYPNYFDAVKTAMINYRIFG